MLTFFDTLTREKKIFKPLNPKQIGLYVCGMTVYDYCHIGHARIFVTFDMLTRFLRSQGYSVRYVRNITDIDDKIIKRAQEMNTDIFTITDRFITAMHEDESALGIISPDVEPRATEFIAPMIALIQTLLKKEFAYISDDGDVCYRVGAFNEYGKLSHKDLKGLRAGARVSVTRHKHDPLDFVLWKLAKPDEPAWDSPWGKGRPGWHIECSAMATQLLGETFDLHGGGADLQFPHHENEIAQSEAAHEKPFVNTWLHVGFVQINSEKMSKSLNNFFTIREVLEKYPAEVVRYFLLSSQYRSPLNYTEEALKNAKEALDRLYLTLRDFNLENTLIIDDTNNHSQRFIAAMNDDLNTPDALAVLFDIAREINREKNNNTAYAKLLAIQLKALANILGLLQQTPSTFLQAGDANLDTSYIESQIQARLLAKQEKQWANADRIRTELEAKGVILEDTAGHTTWRIVK